MNVTIVYDNETYLEGTISDWGFSCVVDVFGRRILFDTGTNGQILMSNIDRAGIGLDTIDDIFISHPHHDHTGGLREVIAIIDPPLHIPNNFSTSLGTKHDVISQNIEKIYEGIYSTGALSGIEQSLLLVDSGTVDIIVGCSHPGVGAIMERASELGRVRSLIGGLHGFNEYDLLKDLQTVCPTHCTQNIDRIKELYPDKYIRGGTGRIIRLE